MSRNVSRVFHFVEMKYFYLTQFSYLVLYSTTVKPCIIHTRISRVFWTSGLYLGFTTWAPPCSTLSHTDMKHWTPRGLGRSLWWDSAAGQQSWHQTSEWARLPEGQCFLPHLSACVMHKSCSCLSCAECAWIHQAALCCRFGVFMIVWNKGRKKSRMERSPVPGRLTINRPERGCRWLRTVRETILQGVWLASSQQTVAGNVY